MSDKTPAMPSRAVVRFDCTGTASGKMRNELEVHMVTPMHETFMMATDEGAFHGGEASAPPPLALFVGALTGCTYETAPRSFEIDIMIDSDDPLSEQLKLVETAKKGCFIEQTLGRANTISHRIKTANGWQTV